MKNAYRNIAVTSIATLALGWGSLAIAQESATFDATAEVAAVCEITAGNALAFGQYNPVTAAAVEATTTISVTCSDGMTGTEVGLVSSGEMSDNATTPNALAYGLFQEASRTTAWGDSVGVDRQSVAADGMAQVMTVYGRINADQTTAPVGSYAETVTATVYF